MIRRQVFASIRFWVVLSVLTGVLYPLVVTGVSRLTMPHQSDGSLVAADGRVVGSELLGQRFTGPRFFHSRPGTFDPLASGASNLGPTNPDLVNQVRAAVAAYRKEFGLGPSAKIPADAVESTASNLDPDISVPNAMIQAPGVARARGLPAANVIDLVHRLTQGRTLGFLGESRVNVLELNLALGRLGPVPEG